MKYAKELLLRKKSNIDHEFQYFFMHIPKTAGTSFLTAIYRELSQMDIYPNYFELVIKNRARYLSLKEFDKANKKRNIINNYLFLSGHYKYSFVYRFTKKPKVISFFREPYSRAISSLVQLKTKNKRYLNTSVSEILAERPKLAYNQSVMLGYQPRKENYKQAEENLSRLDFVGLKEEYENSIKLFNKMFNKNLHVHRSNQAKQNFTLELNKSEKQMIEEMSAKDEKIYNLAKEKFSELKTKYKIV